MLAQRDASHGWTKWRAGRLLALASVLCYTGVRASEALYLQISDLDLDGGFLHVREHEGHRLKTLAADNVVPLPPPLIPILKEWLAHRMDAPPDAKTDPACPWVFPNISRSAKAPWVQGSTGQRPLDRLKAVASQAGVEGFTLLSCRHSVVTHLKTSWGAGEGFAKLMCRHTNLSTQKHYTHSDLDGLREGASRIEY